ncbi:hypothetical protein GCM10023093_22150 [Nemorincola caseinilytica]|uniref:Uncharacterized protein n=1 Tax=Nemorincola caseinilytica TaxID=2054315 RepID=A0ABP8NHD6_9BACT
MEKHNRTETENNDLSSWVKGALKQVNNDFPLSGGETDDDLTAPEEAEEEHKSFLDGLNTHFPLSGGETEDEK